MVSHDLHPAHFFQTCKCLSHSTLKLLGSPEGSALDKAPAVHHTSAPGLLLLARSVAALLWAHGVQDSASSCLSFLRRCKGP